ncbi:coiled-coil domain-containing protein 22 [Sarcoptes scabiei]|nr:coiled-coil domain-containing protein 22 [Sarcoptes scabiei]
MFEMIFLKSPQNNHPIIVELTMEISSRSQSVDFIPLDRSNDAIDTKRFEFELKSKKKRTKMKIFPGTKLKIVLNFPFFDSVFKRHTNNFNHLNFATQIEFT